jgi:hypothetical protein
MAKRHLRLVSPATVNRTVRPKRLPNGTLRTREYLTEAEVERLMKSNYVTVEWVWQHPSIEHMRTHSLRGIAIPINNCPF